ncbi:MAG: hypothetical protein LCH30_06955 [Proteobacteria bacterium]|nr:hypothetical protein [Pseudomonadota bacterium]
MNDFKSKLPDLKEVTSMATKFYKDMKESVCEIIKEYKDKREELASSEELKTEEKPTTVTPPPVDEVTPKPRAKKPPKSEV